MKSGSTVKAFHVRTFPSDVAIVITNNNNNKLSLRHLKEFLHNIYKNNPKTNKNSYFDRRNTEIFCAYVNFANLSNVHNTQCSSSDL